MLTVFYIGGNISRYIMNCKIFLIQLLLHVFITISTIEWNIAQLYYRIYLIKLKLLLFMYILDINDIMFFFITSLKFPTSSFNIHDHDYVDFSIWFTFKQVIINYNIEENNHSHNFYFYRLPRIWNALSIISYELLRPATIKYKLQNYFYNHFERNACTFSFICPCSRCNQTTNVPNYDYL